MVGVWLRNRITALFCSSAVHGQSHGRGPSLVFNKDGKRLRWDNAQGTNELGRSNSCPLTPASDETNKPSSDAPALPKLSGSCSIKDREHQTLQIRAAVALVRQSHTGWVQRMNNSLPCAQTLCCETNIQQHLCAWRGGGVLFPWENLSPASPRLCFLQIVRIPLPSAGMTDSSRGSPVWCTLLLLDQTRNYWEHN